MEEMTVEDRAREIVSRVNRELQRSGDVDLGSLYDNVLRHLRELERRPEHRPVRVPGHRLLARR